MLDSLSASNSATGKVEVLLGRRKNWLLVISKVCPKPYNPSSSQQAYLSKGAPTTCTLSSFTPSYTS
ncbi:hypothetical protein D3C84_1185100 [compost metagenome]